MNLDNNFFQVSKLSEDQKKIFTKNGTKKKPISGRVDRASATEAVDTGSIPGRVKPKTIKIGIHSFPA